MWINHLKCTQSLTRTETSFFNMYNVDVSMLLQSKTNLD